MEQKYCLIFREKKSPQLLQCNDYISSSAKPVDEVEQSEGPGCDGEEDELQHIVPLASWCSLPVCLSLRLARAKHLLTLAQAQALDATHTDLGPGDESEEDDDVADQRTEGEGDAGEAPELQVCHSCRGDGVRGNWDGRRVSSYLRHTVGCLGWPS